MAVALPLLWLRGQVLRALGRMPAGDLDQRIGRGAGIADLWLHGASNGELTSVRGLLAGLLRDAPDLRVIVTCNSLTARDMVRSWAMDRVSVALAPYDARGPLGRFLDGWQPAALVLVESELWPERIAACTTRGIAVGMVGARLSERSAARWRRFAPGLIAGMLGQITFAAPQDAGTGHRLVALGLPSARLGPAMMLKAGVVADGATLPFAPPCPRSACLLAASTHEGEDAPILEAFAGQLGTGSFTHLIMAPRHPRRGPEVAALIAARGMGFGQRSSGEWPRADQPVFLADTLGEMALWYASAGVTIIGGSFADKGGHTPYEPAAYGSAIVHGPDVANFAEPFAALDMAGAAVALVGVDGLKNALQQIDFESQMRLTEKAAQVLEGAADTSALRQHILLALGGRLTAKPDAPDAP